MDRKPALSASPKSLDPARVFSRVAPPLTLTLALALAVLGFVTSKGLPAAAATATPVSSTRLILVVGAEGEPEFGSNFVHQATLWQKVAQAGGVAPTTLGLTSEPEPASADGATNDLQRLESLLRREPKDGADELWLVLVGHGTFDGREARFNLRGPDLTASNLVQWLRPFRRPVAVIDTASASGPFLAALSASNRVVVTATRSGFEHNFTRFGRYLAEAMADPQGDLDQDGQTSLLEAFLSASYRVAEFYKTEGRMATEHALIDDNGDGLGTPAEWFRGLRAIKRPKDGAALDGLRASQFHLVRSPEETRLAPEIRARRDGLERQVAALRESRSSLGDETYFARLEGLLLELARLYPPTTASTNGPAKSPAPSSAPPSAPPTEAAR